MSLDKRRLQRRHNLRQSADSSTLMHHSHAYYVEKYITLFAGDKAYDNIAYPVAGNGVGCIVTLSPVDLMYCVNAELIITREFTALADSYTIDFNLGSNNLETTSTDVANFENQVIDISDLMLKFYKNFSEEAAYIRIKVSDAAAPVTLYGAHLKFTLYMEDSYGDYQNSISPMLIDDSIANKLFINKMDDASKDFEYLSKIKPR